MNTTITVMCENNKYWELGTTNCDWVTDFSTISKTNPTNCPKCGGQILIEGTNDPYTPEAEEK